MYVRVHTANTYRGKGGKGTRFRSARADFAQYSEDATNYLAKLANLCYVNMVCLCWTYICLQQIKEHILCRK